MKIGEGDICEVVGSSDNDWSVPRGALVLVSAVATLPNDSRPSYQIGWDRGRPVWAYEEHLKVVSSLSRDWLAKRRK